MELVGDIYTLALDYCCTRWQNLDMISDYSMDEGTPLFASKSVRTISYMCKDEIRYGCLSNRRTKVDSFAFIREDQQRTPVEINTIMILQIGGEAPHLCALICRMVADNNLPRFPWDL